MSLFTLAKPTAHISPAFIKQLFTAQDSALDHTGAA